MNYRVWLLNLGFSFGVLLLHLCFPGWIFRPQIASQTHSVYSCLSLMLTHISSCRLGCFLPISHRHTDFKSTFGDSLVISMINKQVLTDIYFCSTSINIPPTVSGWLKRSVLGRSVFMNYKQDVIIQSVGPWMSERLFSLQQELMRAEISEPQPQTGHIHHRGLRREGEERGSQKRKVGIKAPLLRWRWGYFMEIRSWWCMTQIHCCEEREKHGYDQYHLCVRGRWMWRTMTAWFTREVVIDWLFSS